MTSVANLLPELRRRGVLGAVTAYGVIAAGGLQVADIITHALEMPGWTMRLLVGLAAAGLPVTAVVSWFYDLTRQGLVKTAPPADRPWGQSPPLSPVAPSPAAVVGGSPAPGSPAPGSPAPGSPAPLAGSPVPGVALVGPIQAASLQHVTAGALLAGRYRIERELGSGGMGRVLAAVDAKLGRRVAVKVVTGAHDPSRIRRFEQEARNAGSLEHPNVLAVYDLGEHEGTPFLVTELLDGHTLRTVMARGAMPPDAVRDLGLQLARGLAAAHGRGVVHRDLKPENLFLTSDGRLKILDFGLAKLVNPNDDGVSGQPLEGLTATGAIFGTPGYLSPEQARGLKAGTPSDVFSAGAVLYEMLCGARAFPGGSLIEAGHAALALQPAPLPAAIPYDLAQVVAHCLVKDPAKRIRDGAELVRSLESVLARTEQATGSDMARRMGASPWRRRLALLPAALAVGAVMVSVLWLRLRERDRGRAQTWTPVRTATRTALPSPPSAPVPPVEIPALPESGFDPEKLARELRTAFSSRVGPTNIGAIQASRALLTAGMKERAEGMLREAIAGRPKDVYLRLHLFALQRRLGRSGEADAEMHKFVETLEGDEWLNPLARAYAGQLADQAVIAAAASRAEDNSSLQSRLCEAYFYLGLLHVTAPEPDTKAARKFFERAMGTSGRDIERGLAEEELEALGVPRAQLRERDQELKQAERERAQQAHDRAREERNRAREDAKAGHPVPPIPPVAPGSPALDAEDEDPADAVDRDDDPDPDEAPPKTTLPAPAKAPAPAKRSR